MMFVVTLPRSAIKNPLLFAKKAKKAGADILEIRSDLTPGVKPFRSPLPLLLAIRGEEKGLIDSLKPTFVDFDVETQNFASLSKNAPPKFIRSYHNYSSTPSIATLKKIVQKMCSSKTWMIKIAVQMNSYSDILTIHNLQSFLNKKSVRSTVLAMGPKAHLTRVLSPMSNSFTYACLDGFDASAQGQLPMSFYNRFANVLRVGRRPTLYGIVGGSQVSASMSPTIQNALFQKYKIPAVYSCFPAENLRDAWVSLTKIGVTGFSVTAPYKKDILAYLDMVDPLVAYLASANTVVKTKRGWMGFNTDVEGIVRGYPQLKKARDVAILGAGGVVPAVIEALSILAPDAFVTVYARDTKKSAQALAPFSADVRSLQSLKNARHDAIICAIADDVSIPLPRTQTSDLTPHTSVAIDLRYGKRTKFMIDGEKKRYTVYDGLPMLIHQALRQFEIFTGKKTRASDIVQLKKILEKNIHSTF